MAHSQIASRVADACTGLTASAAGDRRRAFAVLYWLRAVATSDASLLEERAWTIKRYRRILRTAGIAPLENGYQLADVGEALRIRPRDGAALVRLAWVLRGATGRLALADAARHFAPIVAVAAAELAYRAQPEHAPRRVP